MWVLFDSLFRTPHTACTAHAYIWIKWGDVKGIVSCHWSASIRASSYSLFFLLLFISFFFLYCWMIIGRTISHRVWETRERRIRNGCRDANHRWIYNFWFSYFKKKKKIITKFDQSVFRMYHSLFSVCVWAECVRFPIQLTQSANNISFDWIVFSVAKKKNRNNK